MNTWRPRRRAVIGDKSQRRHRPDYWLIIIILTLMVIGVIVVYAISPGLSVQRQVGENYFVSKQIIAIVLGLVAFTIVSHTPVRWWRNAEKPLIIAAAVAAVAVQLFGEEVNGAARWVHIGGLSFQAAELIKFALLVWLAGFLVERARGGTLNDYQRMFKPLFIALGLIAGVVGWLESDLGSAGVMVAIMTAMVFVAGVPLRRILAVGGVVLLGTVLLIASSPYRRERIFTFMNPEQDCLDAGYQACQALIAIGSGGMVGKGLAHSVQAYGYLPEAANDSIFAIYAEKFGFIGTMVLIGLFIALFARLFRTLERAPDSYSRLLVTGVLAWLSTQAIINMGAMLGLLPLKGITLPFISYGGTSVVFVSAAAGLAFQISRYTTYGVNLEQNPTERKHYDSNSSRRRVRGSYYPGISSR